MNLKIKELPLLERPYEKLEKYGAKSLSDAELLAIIIKTGTKECTSVDLARQIILRDSEKKGLRFLNDISMQELTQIKGIGKVKALQIKAIVELTKRISMPLDVSQMVIKTPKDVFDILKEELKLERKEVLKAVLLNNKNRILNISNIAKGAQNSVSAEPREILAEALKVSAMGIILVHNHPSGDPTPSRQDIIYTNRLCEASNMIGIQLLDHIIIGDEKYISLKQKGKL